MEKKLLTSGVIVASLLFALESMAQTSDSSSQSKTTLGDPTADEALITLKY